jgi:hypothetical protein
MAASRPAVPARALAAAAAIAAAAMAGCGDDGRPPGDRAGSAPSAAPSPYVPPRGIPSEGTGPPDPARLRVIRTWVRELREGDIGAAARTFANGAIVQNGTPVLKLRTYGERRLFVDEGFPCGARVSGASRARRHFTIVNFTLTPRVGGSCSGPGGGSARAAIRVRGGRITEWYRLPDGPGPPDAAPPPENVGPPV